MCFVAQILRIKEREHRRIDNWLAIDKDGEYGSSISNMNASTGDLKSAKNYCNNENDDKNFEEFHNHQIVELLVVVCEKRFTLKYTVVV